MSFKEDVQAVRDLLSVESRWTQGAFALDAQRQQVNAESSKACSWCLMGAIQKVEPTLPDAGNYQSSSWLK